MSLEKVLSDGELHPVMSRLSIRGIEPTTFWISELSEHPFKERVDHSDAVCYRVDLQPERNACDGIDHSLIGRVAILGADVLVQVTTVGDEAYVINRTVSDQRYHDQEESKARERYRQFAEAHEELFGDKTSTIPF